MDSCKDLIPRRIIFDDGIDAMHTFDMQSFCFDEDQQISLTIDFKFDTPLDRDVDTTFHWNFDLIESFCYDEEKNKLIKNKFRGAIFDGLLRQLPNLFFEQFSTHIGWEIFVERSSMDFFANFQFFSFKKFRRAFGWKFFGKRSSMDFFAKFQFFSLRKSRRASVGKFS